MKMITQTFIKIPRVIRRVAVGVFVVCATLAQAQTPVFTNLWSITNLTFPDLPATGDTVRGVAIGLSGNVVFESRTTSNHISTLDAADGNIKLGSAVATPPLGGTLALVGCRVSGDGYVYAANLSGSPASRFVIYRWNSDIDFSTPPLVVYDSGAATSFQSRIGDYIDLRGSGTNTEIVAVGNGASPNLTTNFVLLRPTDDQMTNFTASSITLTNGINIVGGGVTFDGTNNAIFVKQTGVQTVRRFAYNPISLTATQTTTFNMDQSANNGIKYFETNGYRMIATVTTATVATNAPLVHRAKVLQLTTPSNAVVVLDRAIPGGANGTNGPNGNSLGLVDVRNDRLVFSEPNNGILYVQLTGFVTNTPPTLGSISGGGTYVGGYPVTLSVSTGGPGPQGYQWYFNTNTLISTATNFYAIPALDPTNAGVYRLIVTNPFGMSTSSFAGLTVLPAGYSSYATNLWSLAPGSRSYLTTADTQRGIAHDPVLNKLILVSRAPTNAVYLLDATTGADDGVLDLGTILANPPAPGTFMFNMCGVGSDGAVYVGNLITSGVSDNFTLYRWADATTNSLVSQAYLGNPGITRIGDTLAVRGATNDTEILASFRTGSNVCLFLPNDGLGQTYAANILTVTNLPGDAQTGGFAGLGLAFGPGNTFWAKSSGGFNLRLVSYDTNTMLATVVQTYTNLPSAEAPLGADNINGYVATVGFGETPQNLSLWDVARGEPVAFQLDRELFPVSNANLNGTGSVAVDAANRRIYALDSNNGIIALSYSLYTMNIGPTPEGGIVTWPGTGTLQSSTNVVGAYVDIPAATTPYTNTTAGQIYFRVRR